MRREWIGHGLFTDVYVWKQHWDQPSKSIYSLLPLVCLSYLVMGHVVRSHDIDGLVQDCSNSSALAMELLQSCTKPSISGSSPRCRKFPNWQQIHVYWYEIRPFILENYEILWKQTIILLLDCDCIRKYMHKTCWHLFGLWFPCMQD